MEYRRMGNSDLEVSAIGFGCWEMGGGYGPFAAQEVIAAIHRALDLGVTLFDTARSYGRGASEELLAQGLGAPAPRRHHRDERRSGNPPRTARLQAAPPRPAAIRPGLALRLADGRLRGLLALAEHRLR